MKTLSVVWLIGLLTACGGTMNLTMMPRDSGTAYVGELQGDGSGSGSMSVTIGDTTCKGPAARVASNQSFGFANSVGFNNRGTVANSFGTVATTGDSVVKAILSCSNGKGLRCDLSGRDMNGGGICVDDTGRVFDVVVTRK
jgi:hypothetical protein